jgi:hypothetical protein
MDTHGVSAVVVEGISYYRAAVLFPDLAGGLATPPFRPLGEQTQYQVSGGKPVYAYRIGTALQTQSIYPGLAVCIESTSGTGKTASLAKGLVLEVAGRDISGEGMGFGVPIVQYPDGWVYSRTATTVDVSTASQTSWKRTYAMDEMGGDKAHNYAFAPIGSRGSIEVTYTVDGGSIHVSIRVLSLTPGYTEVNILNEQSAAFNDFASEQDPTLADGQFGRWMEAHGSWARLQSKELGAQWSVPSLAGAQIDAGRELAPPTFDWAGLDYVFASTSFTGTDYVINVQGAR